MTRRTTVAEIGGTPVDQVVLESGKMAISLLSFGAITQDLKVFARGKWRSVVLGFENARAYGDDPYFHGAIVGRVANRIANGRFSLDGKDYQLDQNDGVNQLHGGRFGLSKQHWQMDVDRAQNAVTMQVTLPHLHMGYPAKARFELSVQLRENRVIYDMRAFADRPTPINLAQHNYYNLEGRGQIWGHRLRVPADRYLDVDESNIPTGKFAPVGGTRYDFRRDVQIGAQDLEKQGSDINLVLAETRDTQSPAAELSAGGLRLRMFSEKPGLQFYTGTYLPDPFTGLCLETQGYPDAPNHAQFPSVIATPENPYRQVLTVEVSQCA